LINGFVVIDKPAGITSHDVVSRVRRILGIRKVGHTGTLDPFATGVLPVAVNDGTKAIPFLDESFKSYQALMRLGFATDTLDMTGRVLSESDWLTISRSQLDDVLLRFSGTISQIPPMFSAIKQNGQPLYKLARQGQEVERQVRQVEIRELAVLAFEPPLVSLLVVCSRGTYVRSLADDIGRELGCGAALQELRRIESGLFTIEEACTLESLEEASSLGKLDALFMTPSAALGHLADVPISESGLVKISHGIAPQWHETGLGDPLKREELQLVRLTNHGVLVAVAALDWAASEVPRLVLKRVFV